MPQTKFNLNKIQITEEEKKNFSPKNTAENLLSLVKKRDNEILRMRHGVDNEKPKTLEAIGQKFSLTRERVRQLQNQAIKTINKHGEYKKLTSATKKLILHTLEQFGGFISFDNLVDELNRISKNEVNEENAIKFLLSNFMTEADLIRNEDFKLSLRSFEIPFDFILEVIEAIEKIFTSKNILLSSTEIMDEFKKSEFYKVHQPEFDILLSGNGGDLEKIIFSYINASKKFVLTPMDQWGLSEWEVVSPRRINGKIYLVLLAKQKPMHFTEIAEIINSSWTERRDIKAATVHNELIADERFILIGKGTYGLKDWNFEGGTVVNLVKRILEKNPNLSTAEIIEHVKDKKMVKESTIRLAIKKAKAK
jgi:DNA-directed RNA polymerase delta subunit